MFNVIKYVTLPGGVKQMFYLNDNLNWCYRDRVAYGGLWDIDEALAIERQAQLQALFMTTKDGIKRSVTIKYYYY